MILPRFYTDNIAYYCSLGCRLFPCYHPNDNKYKRDKNGTTTAKHPIDRCWQLKASNNPNDIIAWIEHLLTKRSSLIPNISICTTGLIAFDCDGPEGVAKFRKLKQEYELPDTLSTESRPDHQIHIYKLPEGYQAIAKQGKARIHQGLDIKGRRQQVVAAGSTHSKTDESGQPYQYRFINKPDTIAQLPDQLFIEWLNKGIIVPTTEEDETTIPWNTPLNDLPKSRNSYSKTKYHTKKNVEPAQPPEQLPEHLEHLKNHIIEHYPATLNHRHNEMIRAILMLLGVDHVTIAECEQIGRHWCWHNKHNVDTPYGLTYDQAVHEWNRETATTKRKLDSGEKQYYSRICVELPELPDHITNNINNYTNDKFTRQVLIASIRQWMVDFKRDNHTASTLLTSLTLVGLTYKKNI